VTVCRRMRTSQKHTVPIQGAPSCHDFGSMHDVFSTSLLVQVRQVEELDREEVIAFAHFVSAAL
jgi:hypothetical protein